MSELPNAATGLVYLGHGRYYDPAIGRPLQPSTAGAPPTVPQALNRYAAGGWGQPGVAEAAVNSPDPFHNPLLANPFKKAVSLTGYETTRQGLRTYNRASLYTVAGEPIFDTVTRAVSRSRLADEMILAAGAVGVLGRPVTPGPLGRFGHRLFDRAVAWNTDLVTERVIIGYHFSHHHRLPAGRLVGGLAASKQFLNFGVGLVVDVSYQAWLDYDNPYLTREQFNQRLIVAGAGSGVSFVATVGVAWFLGPPGWVSIGVGVGVAIWWDKWVAPQIYQWRGLNPERNLAPLQQ
jgi:hypothetical protein